MAWQTIVTSSPAGVVAPAGKARLETESTLCETAGRRVSAAIADEAKRWGADPIVVGAHGRRGLNRRLLRSRVEGVARPAPVSVLLVRGTGSGERA